MRNWGRRDSVNTEFAESDATFRFFAMGGESRLKDTPPPDPRRLLDDRRFLSDLARLSEGLVRYWDLRELNTSSTNVFKLRSRERSAWFAPLKIDGKREALFDGIACPMRHHCIHWSQELGRLYNGRVVEWIDSGVGTEKAAAVVALDLSSHESVLVVAFRGTKSAQDWTRTATSMRFQPLSDSAATQLTPDAPDNRPIATERPAKLMPLYRASGLPCCSQGVWLAYAGAAAREKADAHAIASASLSSPLAKAVTALSPSLANAKGAAGGLTNSMKWKVWSWRRRSGSTPRARVLAAIRQHLGQHGGAGRIVLTGHGLGGSLATVCALDLLRSGIVDSAWDGGYGAPLTLVTFGATRAFNGAFRTACDKWQASGRLAALRVVIAGDPIPRAPFNLAPAFGVEHAISPRLVLWPGADDDRAAVFLRNSDPVDADLRWRTRFQPSLHSSHTALLSAERRKKGRLLTVDADVLWPSMQPPRKRMQPIETDKSCDDEAVADGEGATPLCV